MKRKNAIKRKTLLTLAVALIFAFAGATQAFAMQIFIKLPPDENGKQQNISVDVELTDIVEMVKNKIEDKLAIPANQQKLIFAGKEMLNGTTLETYSLVKDSTLFLQIIPAHTFAAEWSCDETGHWHACTQENCSERSQVSPHTPGEPATATSPQVCTVCGYVIAPALPVVNYSVTAGADQTVQQGVCAVFTLDGQLSKFAGIQVDGAEVPTDLYRKEEPGVCVTLSAAYTQTLCAGAHTLTFTFADGSAQTQLTLQAAPTPSPQTGDGAALWAALLSASSAAALLLALCRRAGSGKASA